MKSKQPTLAIHRRAVQMLAVKTVFALAYLNIKAILTRVADQNVCLILNAHATELVFVINAKTRVLELADKELHVA